MSTKAREAKKKDRVPNSQSRGCFVWFWTCSVRTCYCHGHAGTCAAACAAACLRWGRTSHLEPRLHTLPLGYFCPYFPLRWSPASSKKTVFHCGRLCHVPWAAFHDRSYESWIFLLSDAEAAMALNLIDGPRGLDIHSPMVLGLLIMNTEHWWSWA